MQSDVLLELNNPNDACLSPPLTLAPLLGEELRHLLQDPQTSLAALTQQYGSPLNVVVPQALAGNVERLRTVFRRHGVTHEIFYGAKVNKSPALVRAAVDAGVGVDVSSIYEMRDALHAGIEPRNLCATGPAKTRVFHMALVANRALISVDSVEELDDIEAIAREVQPEQPVRVLLRYKPADSQASRFGLEQAQLFYLLKRLAYLKNIISFEGFHFHLAGYRHEPRVAALTQLVSLVEAAREMGLNPAMIDIGGGLPVRYVDQERYRAYLEGQNPTHYRNASVPRSFYPYGGAIDAATWLDRLLASPCIKGLSVAGYLKSQQLTLAIEPGRSLADQAALSVFRITRVKSLADNEAVIFAEGSSFSACETWFGSEFLIDPQHVPLSDAPGRQSGPVRAWVAGHSCLDEDVISNRLIDFSVYPHAGDLLVYANTAGYQMDLLENEFHRHPMPRRIAATFDARGQMTFSPDDRMEERHDFE
ncbi:Y4yA family PLP-dependent enzyme [Paraburkholderia sp. Ac-20340]|uniref:Y4yA family PLP-dependent enzyme n=1 Tax=Paraburkholderia sp. Ac-20340 TaxID=2703888 RepID=UPI00197E37C1|nr:Y4yA family PLP-dependent enzyme [Paraburkholderia sp. Ac-20340]MBN3857497.1 Y4yA family PLP-dependent enzyme [Paraburkholderia sp. Ac-20340]